MFFFAWDCCVIVKFSSFLNIFQHCLILACYNTYLRKSSLFLYLSSFSLSFLMKEVNAVQLAILEK